MNKKFAVVNSENEKLVSTIKNAFPKNCDIIDDNQDISKYDLIVLTSFDNQKPINSTNAIVLNIHPSLLPAFQGKDAIKEAFIAGVKVSGITIHRVEPTNFYGKIITQVPILIGSSTHFDELRTELENLGCQIYPKVIETILEDKVFDFCNLFSNGCNGNCKNCQH